jgi:K+-transporting ATPase KdpF subunit
LTFLTRVLITRQSRNPPECVDERFDLRRHCDGVLPRQRRLRALLRNTLKGSMENLIIGLIALGLFAYLFYAMVRPEKF